MLRTGQLLDPASHPASRPRTGALLPGTLASPRTGLAPAGCPQLVDWLRHHNTNLLVVMAPNLLDAPPDHRVCAIRAEANDAWHGIRSEAEADAARAKPGPLRRVRCNTVQLSHIGVV